MAFVYPTNFVISEIMPNLMARGMAGRVAFDFCPTVDVNAGTVRWQQDDDYYGLMAMRGVDGAPAYVQRVGHKVYNYEPGIYGEFTDINEQELLTRAGSAPIDNTPIDVADLVLRADLLLINRQFDRMEKCIWDVVLTGTLTVKLAGVNGTQRAYSDAYTTQTFTSTIPWTSHSTATVIADMQAMQQLAVGYSVSFGPDATLYMNRPHLNDLLNNTNANDLGGRRMASGATLNNLGDVNKYFVEQDLPKVAAYDGGYRSAIATTGSTSFIKFIANNKSVLIGKRLDGGKVMQFQQTRQANNPNFAPGPCRYVIDRTQGINGEKRTPANIEIVRLLNGGPAIYYPSAIVSGTN